MATRCAKTRPPTHGGSGSMPAEEWSPAGDLRTAIAALRASDQAACQRVARALDSYLAGARDGLSLDDALGFGVKPGGELWWRAEDRHVLHAALRAAARALVPARVSLSERELIATREPVLRRAANRYALRWQSRAYYKLLAAPPDHNEVERYLFAAFRAASNLRPDFEKTPALPLGRTQLREILSHCGAEQIPVGEIGLFADSDA